MRHYKYLAIFLGILILFGVVEYFRPKPIDWTRTYRNNQKIPFATEALYSLLPTLFVNQSVESVRVPFYNFIKEQKLPAKSIYLYISENCNLDDEDVNQLIPFVQRGNIVFLSGNDFPDKLLDTLHLRQATNSMIDFSKAYQSERNEKEETFVKKFRLDTMRINLLNNRLRKQGKGYSMEREITENHFVTTDSTLTATVLGVNQHNQYNFLKFRLGKGELYLHSAPEAFTNYYLLKQGDDNYAFKALSYLPDLPVFWDEYAEQGREEEQSILRFLFTSPGLTWAYYITLAGLFLFVVFESKRRQRVIPVIPPVTNTSLEFVETVGELYYHQGNHANIAEKKIQHWQAYVRQRFGLKSTELDETFKEALRAKSGLPQQDIDKLIGRIGQVQYFSDDLPESQLIDLNNQIESFYRNTR
ncbi:MAG: DUF4350 domain-containing protein [Siphonobacter sp.]